MEIDALTWSEAVKIASENRSDMASVAYELVARLSEAESRQVLATQLIEEARRVLREEALKVERSAQVAWSEEAALVKPRGRVRSVPATWMQADGTVRCPTPRTAKVVSAEAVREELGLPLQASEYEVRSAQAWRAFNASVREWEDGLEMRWTAELLDTHFALADGTGVTWGSATERDHFERMSMFVDASSNSIEGAARHKAAIAAIRGAGV